MVIRVPPVYPTPRVIVEVPELKVRFPVELLFKLGVETLDAFKIIAFVLEFAEIAMPEPPPTVRA